MKPTATYRLQLHAAFGFREAAAIADYLKDLGVSHVYCSPYLQAAPGSTHGYDVIDHSHVNEELGGEEGHQDFCQELGRAGLGQVLDIVPNHMAIGTRANTWWWDVLENGPSSRYAFYFDVEWDPPESKLRNIVLVPILGDHYGRVLEAGELRIEREGGKFTVRYHDNVLPASPRSVGNILTRVAEACGSDEVGFIADMLSSLPDATATDLDSVTRRHRDKEIAARQLEALCQQDTCVTEAIDKELARMNADPDVLDDFFGRQNYRISYWRTAGRELGYRRFFDINTLVGLRVENPRVFRDTHRRILDWLRTGVIDGVRVDHPDGLRDPQNYFERLRTAAPDAWIIAEKILETGERLRRDWQIAGTTGYDFLHTAGNVLVHPEGKETLTAFYEEFTGESSNYPETVRVRKQQVLRGTLGADLNRLTALFMSICERHRRFRDYTRHEIHEAMRALIVAFPVYRTYVQAEQSRISEEDIRYIDEAVNGAKAQRPDLPTDLFDFIRSVLVLETRGELECEFLMRFQQFTGPAMAKGVEDTTFYAFNRLTSLNEVGSDPDHFGMSVEEFHRECERTQKEWPATMLATSTHDTKRSEDVRARIHLLSEIPDRWAEAVRRWSAWNERYRTGSMPDRNMEYLLYQTLAGAWPIEPERIAKYMEKASREAKTHTSWTEPDPAYDAALQAFIQGVIHNEEFLQDFTGFVQSLIQPGHVNALSQALLKFTAPGVPDTYQGTELWDLSLVDPDNRRPVDYETRRRLLKDLENATPEQILQRYDEGLPKLWLTKTALHLRRRHPEWFGPEGAYEPLAVTGEGWECIVAFARAGQAATVAVRFPMSCGPDWNNTQVMLPPGTWTNLLTGDVLPGGTVQIAYLLKRFPVALLEREQSIDA